jgi:hypothetical protein
LVEVIANAFRAGIHRAADPAGLRGDFEFIVGYGEEHPEAWAGVWFDNEPTVRMVAAFTSDAAQHDAALRPRLRHPDRLVVESRAASFCATVAQKGSVRSAPASRWPAIS